MAAVTVSLYDIKPRFQQQLLPLVRWMAALGVTPNQLTVSAALLSVLAGATVAVQPQARWPLLLLPVVLLVRMALNAADGMLARDHGMQSRLGAVLNEIGDVVSDAALYLPLALVPGFGPTAVVVVVVLAAICEIAGLAAVLIGSGRRHDGPMGKSDRAFWLGALALAAGVGAIPGAWVDAVLWLIAALLIVTAANRVVRALRETT